MPAHRKRAATGSKHRISPALRRAIELMVHEGLLREEAAVRAGIKPHTLYMALRKPHIITLRTSLRHAYISGEAERSLAVMVELRDRATSEHVRLEAARYVAALGGIQPAKQGEAPIGLPSGPVLMLDDLRDEPEVIDADWTDVTSGSAPGSSSDDK